MRHSFWVQPAFQQHGTGVVFQDTEDTACYRKAFFSTYPCNMLKKNIVDLDLAKPKIRLVNIRLSRRRDVVSSSSVKYQSFK